MSVYFISETKLKENTYLSENIDTKIIAPTILSCQDMYILPILGTALYNDLKAELTSDSTLASNSLYKTLLTDYIWPCLEYYVLAEIGDVLTYKYSNKAVNTKNSDNSTPATMPELIRLAGKFMEKAEWYSQRLINYLQQNQADYPKYLNQGASAGIDTIYPRTSMYNTGMYLGNSSINDNEENLKWSFGYPWRQRGND